MAGGGVISSAMIMTADGVMRMHDLTAYAATADAFDFAHALRTIPAYGIGAGSIVNVTSGLTRSVRTTRGILDISAESGLWVGASFAAREMKLLQNVVVGDSVITAYQFYTGSPFNSIDSAVALPDPSLLPVTSTITAPTVDADIMWLLGYLINGGVFRYYDSGTNTTTTRLLVPTGAIETQVQTQLTRFNVGTFSRIDADTVELPSYEFQAYWEVFRSYNWNGGALPDQITRRSKALQQSFMAGVWDFATFRNAGDESFLCTTKNFRLAKDICALGTSCGVYMLLDVTSPPAIYTITNDPTYADTNYNRLNPYCFSTRVAPGAGSTPPNYDSCDIVAIGPSQPNRVVRIEFLHHIPFVVNGFGISPNWLITNE